MTCLSARPSKPRTCQNQTRLTRRKSWFRLYQTSVRLRETKPYTCKPRKPRIDKSSGSKQDPESNNTRCPEVKLQASVRTTFESTRRHVDPTQDTQGLSSLKRYRAPGRSVFGSTRSSNQPESSRITTPSKNRSRP